MGYYYEHITGVDMKVVNFGFHPPGGQRVLDSSRDICQQFNRPHLNYIRQSCKVKYAETNSPSYKPLPPSPAYCPHPGNWNTLFSFALNGCPGDSCLRGVLAHELALVSILILGLLLVTPTPHQGTLGNVWRSFIVVTTTERSATDT